MIRYKKSKYNIVISELSEGNLLIYNTRSGVFGKMDEKTREIYDRIETCDISKIEDAELKKNTETMLQARYIVDADIDEEATVILERNIARYDTSSLIFTIAPTIDCNMCCPYCYEKKRPQYMTAETQDAVVDFIKAQVSAYPDTKKLSITWYGGEPLMHKEAVYNISEKLIGLCDERELIYKANIITNGSLLDEETAKKLAEECKVSSTQVTVDGLGEYHNKKRILKNGEDSYGIIMKNLEAARKYLDISVRVNVDKKNAGQLEELARTFFVDYGWSDNPSLYFAPVENYENSCITDENCLQIPDFAKLNVDMTRVLYSYNNDVIRSDLYPQRSVVHCGGECISGFVIDPDGDLYKCWLDVGDKSKKCGSIDKPFLVTEEYARWVLSELPEKCKKCEYLPVCCGGCAAHRIRNNGEPHCSHTLYSYKEKLKLAYEDYVAQKAKKRADR